MSAAHIDSRAPAEFVRQLRQRGIQAEAPVDGVLAGDAAMHDRGAPVPALVVSPRSEGETAQLLRLLHELRIYERMPVSVKSGGHGYFNGASCTGVMINLSNLSARHLEDDTLTLKTGCLLGHVVDLLARHHKAVPHGDCFGVGAGGHFLTAGWDLLLARRHGLGCQSVVGGRIALWDGTVLDVSEAAHPELLWAMRGGAAASVGVVTQLRLRLLEEPTQVTWRLTPLDRERLALCAKHQAFTRAARLPPEISVSFHFHFDPDQAAPVGSFNICSLLRPAATLESLSHHLGPEITALVADLAGWSERSLLEFRLLPASDLLAAHPELLAEVSTASLHHEPLRYWKRALCAREMAESHVSQVSCWVVPECEDMLLALYDAFESAWQHPQRWRMYALVVMGGGEISARRDHCAMPLGSSLARFEVHWDHAGSQEQAWSQRKLEEVYSILRSREDPAPGRPYRGDVWRADQTSDARLDAVLAKYDRR